MYYDCNSKNQMKKALIIILALNLLLVHNLTGQTGKEKDARIQDIYNLIDNYSLARETRDTVLLKSVLTGDVDQLVSSGEWRTGLDKAMEGMQRSSAGNPGSRTLTVERVRFLNPNSALADARYVIKNNRGETRKMWSTFVVVLHQDKWKITAIRNMLPAGTP